MSIVLTQAQRNVLQSAKNSWTLSVECMDAEEWEAACQLEMLELGAACKSYSGDTYLFKLNAAGLEFKA